MRIAPSSLRRRCSLLVFSSLFQTSHSLVFPCGRYLALLAPNSLESMPKRKLQTLAPRSRRSSRQPTTTSATMKQQQSSFRETTADKATSLTDGVRLATPHDPDSTVILPWVGFGTYKLGKQLAQQACADALETGYRSFDTAFVYGGEKTESLVGQAVKQAVETGAVLQQRSDVFVSTKQWRKYHGYDATLGCLKLSLKRLQMDYIDLWLMHWPGPAWTTMNREKKLVEQDAWHYAAHAEQDLVATRAETWRAMEDACRQGSVRAIGVCNMTVKHLETLKKTATLWPPAVNQVELHPLYPQTELLEYCRKEGIVVQAYASLGGQDTGKAAWNQLLGTGKRVATKEKQDLLHADAVIGLAQKVGATPAQVLLKYGLGRACPIIPKTTSKGRMEENADLFKFQLSKQQVDGLQDELLNIVKENNPDEAILDTLTRLCWRSDPFRHLDFE